jgi:hypothetical protein
MTDEPADATDTAIPCLFNATPTVPASGNTETALQFASGALENSSGCRTHTWMPVVFT